MAEKAEIVLSAKDTTSTAFQSINRSIENLSSVIGGITGAAAFEALEKGADLLESAFEKIDPRGVLEAADALDKLSQRTSLAVEDLGALTYQGKLLGVSQDDLAVSLKRLNQNIAAAARGEEDQANAFKAIGVAVTDANGKIRPTVDILGDIADRFASYGAGPNKVALANALAGKSFETLIPLLNGGKKGIEDARGELDQFGATITGELASKSREFEDNLTKLGVAAGALKVAIAGGLIDSLVDYSNQAVVAAKNGGLLAFSLDKLGDLFSGKLTRDFVFGKSLEPAKLTQAQQEVERLSNVLVGLQNNLDRDPGNSGLESRIDRLTAKLKNAQEQVRGESVGPGRGTINPDFVVPAAPPTKPDAPPLPKKDSGADAEALLRKQLEGRLKVIQASLSQERDLFQFSGQQLTEQFAHGDLSIQAFYDTKDKAQQDYLAKLVAGLQAEIAAQQDFESKATKPQDKQDAANKIVDLNAQISKAYRDAGQAAAVSGVQQQRAFEDAAKGLLELDAQIAELSGDQLGAGLDRNSVRIEELQKQLAKVGGDPAREKSLRDLLDAQVRVNAALDESTRITDREQTAEEALGLAADKAGKSRLESEAAVKALREDAVKQLDAQIAAIEAVTNKTADQVLQLEKLKIARDKAFDATDPALLEYRKLIESFGDDITTDLDDVLTGTESLSQGFKNAEKSLVSLITHDFLTAPLAISLENFVKNLTGVGGTKSGGLGGGDLFSWLGGLLGFGSSGVDNVGLSSSDASALFGTIGYGHTGGVAGHLPTLRSGVDLAAFAGAPRYHNGGVVGLQPYEVPAILKRGEEVITPDDPRHRDNVAANAKRPQTNVFNFTIPPGTSRDTQNQIALRATQALQRVQARDG